MEKTSKEIHWADLAAENIIKNHDKDSYACASGITPSGTVHIGNFREVITTDLVVRALKDKKKNVRFIYSWDDYDVFRKVPKNMPKQEILNEYLRKPIVDTPDTFGCHSSYAEHHEKEFEESLPSVGIKVEFIHQAKKYRNCDYAEGIKIALQNRRKIMDILDKYREEPLESDWYPASIFCEKCNRDDTKITSYDNNYSVSYKCSLCNHEDSFDIRKKGIIKLVWRVDWPYRWYYEKIDFEPGGKDHSTVGGSFDTAKDIVKIYNWQAPLYVMYDFISIKGKGGKISSSKGDVITLNNVLEVYEPEIVRWLFASTRPNSEFAISFDLDVLNLYEEFDKNERIYFNKEDISKMSEDLVEKEKRMYELSCMKLPKVLPIQPTIRHLINLIQVYEFDLNKVHDYFKDAIHNEFDKSRVINRTKCVANWLEKYSPDEFKFKINSESPKINLDDNEKKAVKLLINVLESKKISDEELHNEFYNIMKESSLDIKGFFNLVYRILISKEKGPKLASFINIIGSKRVVNLLKNY